MVVDVALIGRLIYLLYRYISRLTGHSTQRTQIQTPRPILQYKTVIY
jgi:hypothetical protein